MKKDFCLKKIGDKILIIKNIFSIKKLKTQNNII